MRAPLTREGAEHAASQEEPRTTDSDLRDPRCDLGLPGDRVLKPVYDLGVRAGSRRPPTERGGPFEAEDPQRDQGRTERLGRRDRLLLPRLRDERQIGPARRCAFALVRYHDAEGAGGFGSVQEPDRAARGSGLGDDQQRAGRRWPSDPARRTNLGSNLPASEPLCGDLGGVATRSGADEQHPCLPERAHIPKGGRSSGSVGGEADQRPPRCGWLFADLGEKRRRRSRLQSDAQISSAPSKRPAARPGFTA